MLLPVKVQIRAVLLFKDLIAKMRQSLTTTQISDE